MPTSAGSGRSIFPYAVDGYRILSLFETEYIFCKSSVRSEAMPGSNVSIASALIRTVFDPETPRATQFRNDDNLTS